MVATRAGAVPNNDKARRIVVEFAGGELSTLQPEQPVEAQVTLSSGKLLRSYVEALPWQKSWRLFIDFQPDGKKPVDMRAQLKLRGKVLTETFSDVYPAMTAERPRPGPSTATPARPAGGACCSRCWCSAPRRSAAALMWTVLGSDGFKVTEAGLLRDLRGDVRLDRHLVLERLLRIPAGRAAAASAEPAARRPGRWPDPRLARAHRDPGAGLQRGSGRRLRPARGELPLAARRPAGSRPSTSSC